MIQAPSPAPFHDPGTNPLLGNILVRELILQPGIPLVELFLIGFCKIITIVH